MNANGTNVVRAFVRSSGMYAIPPLTAMTAEISTTLTTLSAAAAMTTRETTAPAVSPGTGEINAPAETATSARTETL